MSLSDDDDLITTRQLAVELHVTERACEQWRMHGTGPAFCKIGRKVLYRRRDLRNWLDARTRRSTSEAA